MVEEERESRIANIADGDWTGRDEDGGRWRRIGRQVGGKLLGCTLEEIRPDGRPARYHYHLANEEALFVLEGAGTLRTPTGTDEIVVGYYVSFPAGKVGAHAIERTSQEPIRCLFFSTTREPPATREPNSRPGARRKTRRSSIRSPWTLGNRLTGLLRQVLRRKSISLGNERDDPARGR